MRQVLRGYAHAGIFNLHFDPFGPGSGGDADPALRRREFQGILNQIDQRLAYLVGIDQQQRQIGGDSYFQGNPLGRRRFLKLRHNPQGQRL